MVMLFLKVNVSYLKCNIFTVAIKESAYEISLYWIQWH